MSVRSTTAAPRFAATRTMERLRHFQQRTADYAFDRLYNSSDPALRFLVADEVRLGKTIVARGIVAKVIEHLQGQVERIGIVYVCANAAIDHQNLNRLIPLMDEASAQRVKVHPPTRLTMLEPSQLGNSVNFLSFTPDTSLQLKSRRGTKEERALLFRALRDSGCSPAALRNFLQGPVYDDHWIQTLNMASDPDPIVAVALRKSLEKDQALAGKLREQLEKFKRKRKYEWPKDPSGIR